MNGVTAAATAFDIAPLGVAAAIRAALEDQAARIPSELMTFDPGLRNGVYSMRSHAELPTADTQAVKDDLARCGGDLRCTAFPGRGGCACCSVAPSGEHMDLRRPPVLEPAAEVDWWQVEQKTDDTVVLSTTGWFCGEAWLGYRVSSGPPGRVEQVAALRPKGLLGLAYWRALWPIHLVVFRAMSRRRALGTNGRRRPPSSRPSLGPPPTS